MIKTKVVHYLFAWGTQKDNLFFCKNNSEYLRTQRHETLTPLERESYVRWLSIILYLIPHQASFEKNTKAENS